MDKREFLECLHDADFVRLFIENGWSNPSAKVPFQVVAGEQEYTFVEAAQQKGFRVLVCRTPQIPLSAVRRQLDAKVRKRFDAYLAVFVSSADPFHHLWSVPVKGVDKRQLVTVEYREDDQSLFLMEKVRAISFSFDESPTIIDVLDRVNKTFLVNATEVTKKFYQGFRKIHDGFVRGIRNLADAKDRDWYASVMLNRLMFCYFIQKKGFLDRNEDYLNDKLKWVQRTRGENNFDSFYRSFLKNLFSEGLDTPTRRRSAYFKKTYGRIPYLNGGMFAVHFLEKIHRDIDIPDKVFEDVFAFFDQWRWHLDTRITATGRDINPDVLGYIFEQYINDRAQMGAYYTKEDITEYIGRNTIIPWLWKKVVGDRDLGEFLGGSRSCATAADRYIFPAMRKGIDLPLPSEIEKGVSVEPQKTLRARRAEWNKPADDAYALPTEIWRETVARRQRCAELRRKIAAGEITDVNDFITYNLDIRTFTEDLIRNTSDHLFVRHFYAALRKVTVLDPTCGSGAFLFAALNILEPLYEACLDRMEEFHEKDGRLFKDELAEIQGKFRSNQKYFIYKTIILRNLYGVDIMHEATEIARLRLFLKMVAAVDVDPRDENLGLDPLPDIDFNIRCGNTLVGFANPQGVKDAILPADQLALDTELYDKVERKAADVADLYEIFKREQQGADGSAAYCEAKKKLNERLAALNGELDRAMAKRIYGINPDTLRGNKAFEEWKRKTQPFHWYSEFYGITVANGGFDVIIGNPPYVEYGKEVKELYTIDKAEYKTLDCGNLHAFVAERSFRLSSESGLIGLIVPLPSMNTSRMVSLQKLVKANDHNTWISAFDERPSGLFEGVDQRLIIEVFAKGQNGLLFTTGINRWRADTRENIFVSGVRFTQQTSETMTFTNSILKVSSSLESRMLNRFYSHEPINCLVSSTPTKDKMFYRTAGGRYWKVFLNTSFGTGTLSEKCTSFRDVSAGAMIAILSSDVFWWYYSSHFDMFNLKDYMIFAFRINPPHGDFLKTLTKLGNKYLQSLDDNAEEKEITSKTRGTIIQKQYRVRLSKPIIDEIDEVLAEHYGFTEEELDFIINYDIKYRMGDELNAGE